MAAEERVFQSGTWPEIFVQRAALFAVVSVYGNFMFFSWRSLGLFLLGICFVRYGLLMGGDRHRRTYHRMVRIGLAIGIPLQAVAIVVHTSSDISAWMLAGMMVALYIGSMGMCLAYTGAMALLCLRRDWVARLRPLAAVGRMALTNYLCHSVICGLVFYSYGLGLFGKIGPATALLIVLAIFLVQLVVSPIWLRYFRFGPMEWLWRSLTYWRLQPMR
jgi:uncharacterized protein